MSSSVATADFVRNDYLTIGQLASNIGWTVRFIEGLVRTERLPGLEIDGAWHFRRVDVIDWLEQKIQTLDSNRVLEIEKRVETSLVADGTFRRPEATDRITTRMPEEGIALDVAAGNKADVLHALVGLAERTGLIYDRDHLLASLLDRESLSSTGMPGGVALCHPRRPVPGAISTQFVCLLRTAKPVDFGAPDGKGTSVFFLLCAPDERSHLYALARVARILHNGALPAILSASNEAGVKQAIAIMENLIEG
jgi:mannitol/fructose-specific phosphotransferase system IIA component (Ntr-type)